MSESLKASAAFDGRYSRLAMQPVVDLNAVVSKILEREKARLQQLQVILRCDVMPLVNGGEARLTLAMSQLLQLVLDHPPPGSKLFLYIRCEEVNGAGKSEGAPGVYAISFHSNARTEGGWQESYDAVLRQCGAICEECGGEFTHHLHSRNSCLFTLKLPGNLKDAC
jgi:hypothetical protein